MAAALYDLLLAINAWARSLNEFVLCAGRIWVQVSESHCKAVEQKPEQLAGGTWPAIVAETIRGAINTKLISPTDQIVSLYHRWAHGASEGPEGSGAVGAAAWVRPLPLHTCRRRAFSGVVHAVRGGWRGAQAAGARLPHPQRGEGRCPG